MTIYSGGMKAQIKLVVIGMNDPAAASDLLKPYDARLMRCYPVSTRINHVANDDEECSRPLVIADTQNQLFA